MGLADLVDEFLSDPQTCFSGDEDCIDFEFSDMHTIDDSIKIACGSTGVCGKRHPHQYRIPSSILAQLTRSLLAVSDTMVVVREFDELHDLIVRHCDRIKGAGPLLAYDTALRISEGYLDLEPKYVYLHAGAKEGARHLGVRGTKQPLDAFPLEMRKLTPAQAEDFLCIYKRRLAGLVMRSH
ncbi:conserved hypothetical protein [Roseovarius sp. EC-HK134]|uniref:hypothetical protein n=1 Tax=unclassified Roseovarius TaxID=2614913 RepID=UPI0012585A38|nr:MULTISPECIES: hypothetical protein [unclassified Roseovarius]VVT32802.1 conserved hypothetical protein [Roseovarius sp. EC-HK134]VVT32887.1 conserved hypothetical protein [Roseovarius sp. EC-SD190]